ncbi:MAG: DUF3786 domain-containing protein [bacterium]
MTSGIQKAWENLAVCVPGEVCMRAAVRYDEEQKSFVVSSFGQDVFVCPEARTLRSRTPAGERMLTRFGYFASLVIVSYLAQARMVAPSGHWVKPTDLRSGDIYYKGSHILPLDQLSKSYEGRLSDFVAHGELLGGTPLSFGDVSVKLDPLPRIPMAVIVWKTDDEFPGRADLLLDSTCELHMPADLVWSTAMLSVLMMT